MIKRPATGILSGVLLLVLSANVTMALEIEHAEFQADEQFPEWLQYFREGWGIVDELGQSRQYTDVVQQGAYLHAYISNSGDDPAAVERVLLNGVDLAQQLAPRHRESRGLSAASFMLNPDDLTPSALREQLEAAGAPVWWMVRPNPVPPGGFARVTVRLRTVPDVEALMLRVADAEVRVATEAPPGPRIVATALAPAMDRLTVYLRGGEFSISEVRIDARPVAPSTPEDLQSAGGVLPLEVPLEPTWERGSFHHLSVTTGAGERADALVRAMRPFFSLGMWGYRNDGLTIEDVVRDYCEAFEDHLFNTKMPGRHGDFFESPEGLALLDETGLRLAAHAPNDTTVGDERLYARFLFDEPDVSDYYVDLPWTHRVGVYAQDLVQRQDGWTRADPTTPSLLNVDMTFKPENWLTYGRLPDIFAVDPYYQNRLRDAWWSHPMRVRQFSTPYYVYAVSEIARSGCEPAPLHVILNCTSTHDGERVFRYGTPEEKRIEFYHALAAGARAISYWWFTPYGQHVGCGAEHPDGYAMLQELARLNAQARALADLLSVGCPAHAPAEPEPFARAEPQWLMTRTLLAGADAAVVTLVNLDHASDRQGTAFAPIPRARLTVDLPPWLESLYALRMTREAVADVAPVRDGRTLTFELADVHLTEMLVLADDEAIVRRVRERWEALQEPLAAVTERPYEEWLAGREEARKRRHEAVEQQREELFARYTQLAEGGQWVAASETLGTYGYETEEIWNPTGAKHNAQTWWVRRGDVTDDIVKGLRWIPPAPGRWRVAINYLPRQLYRLRVVEDDRVLDEKRLESEFPAHTQVADWTVGISEGAFIELVQLGSDTTGEMWGRVSPHAVFVRAE